MLLFGGQAEDVPYRGSTTVSTVNGGIAGMKNTPATELKPLCVNAMHTAIWVTARGAMERRLASGGADLTLWNRTAEWAEQVAAELNARMAATPCEAGTLLDEPVSGSVLLAEAGTLTFMVGGAGRPSSAWPWCPASWVPGFSTSAARG